MKFIMSRHLGMIGEGEDKKSSKITWESGNTIKFGGRMNIGESPCAVRARSVKAAVWNSPLFLKRQ